MPLIIIIILEILITASLSTGPEIYATVNLVSRSVKTGSVITEMLIPVSNGPSPTSSLNH